jgi:xanthine dehydrogenase YagS FAD-binding subunit
MKNFTYYRPQTAEAAVGLLDAKWGTAELLAGGTDLLDLQKQYVAQPDKVVSVSGLGKEFRSLEVRWPPGRQSPEVLLGAGVTLGEIAAHPDLRKAYPALSTAAESIGGPQIRNMGTLGGNLCQRNRCWYFRDEYVNCLLKGGGKCYALDGENRYHSIFTQAHKCVIVNPSTLAPVLIALRGAAEVLGPKGKRTVELASFFRAPATENDREHVLEPNEILLSITIPVGAQGTPKGVTFGNASYEVRQKLSYDWPVVQAAVALNINDGKAANVRIVLGHVAPTPRLAEGAAQALEGKEITEETAGEAGKAAAQGAKPLAQNGYKVKLVEVAVKRAILTAAGQKKYWEAAKG